jgi:phosphate acetyltransferase
MVEGPAGVSADAVREKGITSLAGHEDILVVPDLEAGNMLAKQLSFLAGADVAGIGVGARVPIFLTSRADSARTRIAVAVLTARASPSHHEAG